MPLLVTRGPKVGTCNICGEVGPLTEDHTPPKSCVRPTNVQLQSLVHRLAVEPAAGRGRLSQNGVKYRTLCGRCNSDMLGLRYDPALAAFTNNIAAYVNSPIALPDEMNVSAAPQKIMRAVLGHLCAQGVGRYEKGAITEPCRDYFLDDSLPLPSEIKIYYWLYPHRTQILVRDAAYIHFRTNDPVVMWFMKFFPVGFAIIFDRNNTHDLSLHELSRHRASPIDEEVEVPIRLRPAIHQFWPEAPSDDHGMMFGPEAIYADERPRS